MARRFTGGRGKGGEKNFEPPRDRGRSRIQGKTGINQSKVSGKSSPPSKATTAKRAARASKSIKSKTRNPIKRAVRKEFIRIGRGRLRT